MADEETAKVETTTETTVTPEETVIAKADNPDAVRNLIESERAARKAAETRAEQEAAKVKEFETRDQTDAEKLTGERDEFKTEAEKTKAENLRLRVGLKKKLPEELIDRLQGANQEEMEQDADRLLGLLKPSEATDLDQGSRATAKETDMNAFLRGR